jgi:hypothetical protein
MMTNSNEHLCKNYIDEWDQDPEFGSLGRLLMRSSDPRWVSDPHVEQTKPVTLCFADCLDGDASSVQNDTDSLYLYMDGSFRT